MNDDVIRLTTVEFWTVVGFVFASGVAVGVCMAFVKAFSIAWQYAEKRIREREESV